MAVIKVFDSIGVKTLAISGGNASEQDYDEQVNEDFDFDVEETD